MIISRSNSFLFTPKKKAVRLKAPRPVPSKSPCQIMRALNPLRETRSATQAARAAKQKLSYQFILLLVGPLDQQPDEVSARANTQIQIGVTLKYSLYASYRLAQHALI
jgi:hypothetical protein